MTTLFLLLVLAQTPDNRGEVATRTDSWQGQHASAPIPDKFHIRNEGGSDGLGLCVYASAVMAGATQGVADLAELKQSALWKHAKSRPGGSWPEKLAKDLNTVYPFEKYGERWQQYVGTDFDILAQWSDQGRVVCSTMNTGALYNYKPIHHMINVIGFKRGGYAGVVDNNEPGVRRWMPAKEFERRAIDGGTAWFFSWDKLPAAARSVTAWVAFALLAVGSVAILLLNRKAFRVSVAALALMVCVQTASAQSWCDPRTGQCYTVSPRNTVSGGQAVWYPAVQNPSTSAQVAGDWTDGYREHVDSQGRRYLVHYVDSKHGKGWVYFRPDAWVEAKPQATETPKAADNFGVDVTRLKAEARESYLTNDPGFNPNRATFVGLVPDKPLVSVAVGWFACGVGLAAFVAFLFNFRRHRGAP